MNVFEAIERRRSIRKFKRETVEKEKLNRILEAARLSPSAANRQPWRLIVLASEKARKSMQTAYGAEWFIQAPVIIVACAVPQEAWCRADGEEYWKVDIAIAMQNLILTATELGLGTCWIANFNEESARLSLGIPRSWRIVAMTPLGYPSERKGPVRERRQLQEITIFK